MTDFIELRCFRWWWKAKKTANDLQVWLSQKQLAELFCVEIKTVNYHMKEIFKRE